LLYNLEKVESSLRIIHLEAMPQSLAKVLMHVVFSKKDRRPFLRDKAIREELHLFGIDANPSGLAKIHGS
jgi:hypothetical protein